ncbi:MAG: lysozyme [Hyphomicrobium sp.]|nr:lysozyme [Hyphomicrobium sp.]
MIDVKYLDAIKSFEGFTPRAEWDYAQSSNGYGTKALHEGEIIDRAEADRRFKAEIKAAYDIVDRFAPNLDDGSKAALTSLTYNAGTAWTKSGLGNAIRSGDIETAKSLFQQYNKAGGEVLSGLQARRDAEMAWFNSDSGQSKPNLLAARDPTEMLASSPRIPERAAAQAEIIRQAASEIAKSSAPQTFPSGQISDSIIDRSAPQLRRDAALTLANILSVLSMSHLDKDGATASRDANQSNEQRASEVIKRAIESAA